MEVADPAAAATDCDFFSTPTVTAVPGTTLVSLFDGGVAASSSCTVTVDVVATGIGSLDNLSGELTSFVGFTTLSSGKASATLDVTRTDLALTKSFTDDPTPPGGAVTLEFTITNFDRNFAATNIAFTDALPAGLTFNSLLFDDCNGTLDTGTPSLLSYSGGNLSAGVACTIRVLLDIPGGATPGSYTNTTGTISGDVDSSPVVGNAASDDLFVSAAPLLTKEFTDDPVSAGDTVTLRFYDYQRQHHLGRDRHHFRGRF